MKVQHYLLLLFLRVHQHGIINTTNKHYTRVVVGVNERTNERTVRMVEHEWPTSFHYVALYSNLNSKSASFRPHVPFEKLIVKAWNHTSNGRRMDGWVGGWQMSCCAGQHKHSHLIILFTKSPINCKSTVNWSNWWMEKRTSMPAVGVVVILFMQFNCH